MVSAVLRMTGIGAFVAFILYLLQETVLKLEGWPRYILLAIFVILAVVAIIDALRGGLEDKGILKTDKEEVK